MTKEERLVVMIAHVKTWASAPQGYSEYTPFWELDREKGWVYLTFRGKKFYREHKEAIDKLCREEFEPQVKEWSKRAVEELLAEEE